MYQQEQHYLILNRNSVVLAQDILAGFKVKTPCPLHRVSIITGGLLPPRKFLHGTPRAKVLLNTFGLCLELKIHPPKSALKFACHNFVVRLVGG